MSIIDLSEIKRENAAFLRSEQLIDHFFISSLGYKELGENFRVIMDKAREFGNAEEVETLYKDIYCERKASGKWGVTLPELWEAPRPLEPTFQEVLPLPEKCLPEKLWDFLKAVSEFVQVYPEMCILPLLSVLSLCVQDKALIKHPANSHTETLNLYTITIAAPGERKSGVCKQLLKPVFEFEKAYNLAHLHEVVEYQTQRQMLESERKTLLNAKKDKQNPERLKQVALELARLDPVRELRLLVSDATPEALAYEMYLQRDKIAIIDDEGGVFDTISGIYTGGKANIDICLKAYDGSSYNIIRRTKEEIRLEKPLLTMGLMTQPKHFFETMSNKQFEGRGLIHRFLFSFPKSKAGKQKFISEDIPKEVKADYSNLVKGLLSLPKKGEMPVITVDKESRLLLHDYYEHLQREMQKGGKFEYLKEWASKQFGRCLKITGIFHLLKNKPMELATSDTAFTAINLSMWAEDQAILALGAYSQNEQYKDAQYVLDKLKANGKAEISKSEVLRKCEKFNADEITSLLELLEDYGYIAAIEPPQKRGRPLKKYKLNPYVLE